MNLFHNQIGRWSMKLLKNISHLFVKSKKVSANWGQCWFHLMKTLHLENSNTKWSESCENKNNIYFYQVNTYDDDSKSKSFFDNKLMNSHDPYLLVYFKQRKKLTININHSKAPADKRSSPSMCSFCVSFKN